MRYWAKVGVIGLPFLLLSVLVAHFWVNVPIMDQWEFVSEITKYHQGTLGMADFFAQHNEHRLLFPRLLMFALAVVSNWDVRWEMAASLVMAAAAGVFLYAMLARTLQSGRLLLAAAVTISVILFSPMQWENWLWGWQLQWYMNLLGLVVAVWALATWRAAAGVRVAVAIGGAVLATYSLGSGMFVWAVCAPLFWFIRPLRRWAWVWAVAACASIGLHYVGYQDPINSPARSLVLHAPDAFIKYVLVYLAHPLAPLSSLNIVLAPVYVIGVGGVLLYTYIYLRSRLTTTLLPWLALGLYACLAAASTAVARLGLGVIQAYSSRYTTLAMLLLMAVVVLLYVIFEQSGKQGRPRWARSMAGVFLAAGSLLVLASYGKGVVQMQQYSQRAQAARHCAQTATSEQTPCLTTLYPSPGRVWPRVEYLRSLQWGGL